MNDKQIKLIISDFDGTLFDTFDANYLAYKYVLKDYCINLDYEIYKKLFGLRIGDLASELGISDLKIMQSIKEKKSRAYLNYFEYIKPNNALLYFLESFKSTGKPIVLASTARLENIRNILDHFDKSNLFDFIISEELVLKGKPDPECFNFAMAKFDVKPSETLIFEDSTIGIEAAQRSNANYIVVNKLFYGN